MNLFYSSDPHFGHENIIRYAGRPFGSAREMDERLIEWHNAYVKASDHWWCLGDLTMERGTRGGPQAQAFIKLIRSLNGHKRLLLGNHDHFPFQVYVDAGFEKIQACHVHDNILFTHIPIHPGSMARFIANVHGHIHQQNAFAPVERTPFYRVWKDKRQVEKGVSPYVNICVEKTAYRPLSLDEVKGRIAEAAA